MLAVGIEADEVLRAMVQQPVLQPGLQGGSRTEVNRMTYHSRAGRRHLLCRLVRAAVVHPDNVGKLRSQGPDHAAYHGSLVETPDDDPHVPVANPLHCRRCLRSLR